MVYVRISILRNHENESYYIERYIAGQNIMDFQITNVAIVKWFGKRYQFGTELHVYTFFVLQHIDEVDDLFA